MSFKPWKPCDYTPEVAYALKALQNGSAEPHQQQAALKWIIESAAMSYDLTYIPDSARDSDFAQGRRFVGLQIIKLLNISSKQLEIK